MSNFTKNYNKFRKVWKFELYNFIVLGLFKSISVINNLIFEYLNTLYLNLYLPLQINNLSLDRAYKKITIFINYSTAISIFIVLLTLTLLLYFILREIIYRYKYDRITNVFLSLCATNALKRYLIIVPEGNKKLKNSEIQLNKSFKNLIIDISEKNIKVIINTTANNNADKQLKEMLISIKENITSTQDSYIYSDFTRKNNHYILYGTKK